MHDAPGPAVLPRAFHAREAVAVARDLVGAGRRVGGVGGTIVETKAYGPGSPASHSCPVRPRATPRYSAPRARLRLPLLRHPLVPEPGVRRAARQRRSDPRLRAWGRCLDRRRCLPDLLPCPYPAPAGCFVDQASQHAPRPPKTPALHGQTWIPRYLGRFIRRLVAVELEDDVDDKNDSALAGGPFLSGPVDRAVLGDGRVSPQVPRLMSPTISTARDPVGAGKAALRRTAAEKDAVASRAAGKVDVATACSASPVPAPIWRGRSRRREGPWHGAAETAHRWRTDRRLPPRGGRC